MIKKRLLFVLTSVFMLCLLLPVLLSGCGSDQPAQEGDIVRVDYTLFLSDGTEYETSVGREPLELVIGEGQFLELFEGALVGLKPGQTKTVDIPASEAYGERREDLVFPVNRDQLEEGFEPQVGETVYSQDANGHVWPMVVVEVSEAEIIVDANSPLAGEDLTFKITLIEVI